MSDRLGSLPIDRDLKRFRDIIRGNVRKNLRKFLKNDEMIGRRGKQIVSVPIPEIELPQFRFGQPSGGVGQGDGEEGDPIGQGNDPRGGQAGDTPGDHILEVELTLEELAQMLGEELELPRIMPRRRSAVEGTVDRYTSIRRSGPESLRQFRRTYLTALKRMIATGEFDPRNPGVLPISDDKRYRSWKAYPRPESNAVVIYNRDASGSMFESKTRLVRLVSFWIDAWLQYQYKHVVTRYVIHDTRAAEVSAHDFFHLRIAGGTLISSGYQLVSNLLDYHYSPVDWNIYLFHFTDGENFGYDNEKALLLLKNFLLPRLNMFCYGQVEAGPKWGDTFLSEIAKIEEANNILTAKIESDEDVYSAIKIFLGKGL